jgi:hypothetical protein
LIVGDPAKLAIESDITRAIRTEKHVLPSGFFVLHVGGLRYGVHKSDATLLGSSVGEIEDRIIRRGQHVVPFASEPAGAIADAFRDAIYAPNQEQKIFFGIPYSQFEDFIHSRSVRWAPDGDEAFDDGSYVSQFDLGANVRVIAFRCVKHGYHHDPATLRDLWMDEEEFYCLLRKWHTAHANAWTIARERENA